MNSSTTTGIKEFSAHIFPAFVPEYLGIEIEVLENLGIHFNEYLIKASKTANEPLYYFDINENNFKEDPLKTQYITYIISCCVSDILHEKKRFPDFVTSYSMGIYAALYHCRSVDFDTGLLMIKEVYNLIEKKLTDTEYSMCSIVGLDKNDILGLIRSFRNEVFVINQNNEHSFLLSGKRQYLEKVISASTSIGAIQTRMLSVNHPYHTSVLDEPARKFENYIQKMEIKKSRFKYISAIDTKCISSVDEIRKELIRNLHTPFHWQQTFQYLLKKQVKYFIECGAGESLYRISRFIPGDFKIINIKKISNL